MILDAPISFTAVDRTPGVTLAILDACDRHRARQHGLITMFEFWWLLGLSSTEIAGPSATARAAVKAELDLARAAIRAEAKSSFVAPVSATEAQ